MGELTVKNQSYLTQSERQITDIENLSESYIKYIDLLKKINEEDILSGKAARELEIFIKYAESISDSYCEISSSIKTNIEHFINELNDNQKYKGYDILYPENYAKMRNYTSEHKRKLLKFCESDDYNVNSLNSFFNGLENAWYYFKTEFLGIKNDIEQYQKDLLQMHDVVKKILNNIFNSLWNTDDYYDDYFDSIGKSIDDITDYVEKLNLIAVNVTATPENFDMSNYSTVLDEKLQGIKASLTTVENIFVVTDQDIELFIEDYNENFLQEEVDIINDYISNLKISDNLISGFFIVDDAIGATMQFDSYEDAIYTNEVLDTIMKVVDENPESFTVEKETIDEFKDFLKFIKNNGKTSDILLYLNGLEKEKSKVFKEVLDKIGIDNALKILNLGSEAVDFLAYIFADYSEQLNILNSVQKYCSDNGYNDKIFDNIEEYFSKDSSYIIQNMIEKVLSEGLDTIKDVAKPLKIFDTIMGFVNKGTEAMGFDETAKVRYELLVYGKKVNEYKQGLEDAISSIKNLNKDTKEYKNGLEDVKNMFDFFKTFLSSIYEKMSIVATGNRKPYFDYLSRTIDGLTLKNYKNYNIMTYEEYSC